MKRNKYSVLAMIGHICTDINQGALPAILPFLVLHKGISYASAAGLVFAANSMSAFIQPLCGYLGDKFTWPWLMGLGALLAGGGLALVGFLDSYWAIFAAVTISGIGIALFHPEGGRIANLSAGENKGAGIAFFSVGGSIGFAVGPIITSLALTAFGLKGTAVLIVPAIGMLAAVLFSLNGLDRMCAEAQREQHSGIHAADKDNWDAFLKVSACLTGRSVVSYGLTTFIPLYFIALFMLSATTANAILTLFSATTIVATLFGGYAADRFGFIRAIRGGFLLLAPLIAAFALSGNLYLAIFLLLPIAFASNAPHGATLALGQQCMPNHLGAASGIMLGLTVSIGGMVAPCIGWVGDMYGLSAVMYVVAGFGALTTFLAFLIPNSCQKRTPG